MHRTFRSSFIRKHEMAIAAVAVAALLIVVLSVALTRTHHHTKSTRMAQASTAPLIATIATMPPNTNSTTTALTAGSSLASPTSLATSSVPSPTSPAFTPATNYVTMANYGAISGTGVTTFEQLDVQLQYNEVDWTQVPAGLPAAQALCDANGYVAFGQTGSMVYVVKGAQADTPPQTAAAIVAYLAGGSGTLYVKK